MQDIGQNNLDETAPKLDLSKLKIQGIIWGVKTPQAIINNTVLKVGDLVEGAKILNIEKKGITFDFNGEIFNLVVSGGDLVKA